MISKENLLKGLQELVYNEEGVMPLFMNFSRVLVKHANDIVDDKKDKIETLLARLYQESAGHKKTIYALIKEISESPKDEY